jgi:cystathionine beta-lyase
MKFNTKAIHGGQHPDPALGCNATHISNNDLCTNKPWTSYGEYEYSRTANPTRTALENALASIENGARGLAFSSGLAATDCLMRD